MSLSTYRPETRDPYASRPLEGLAREPLTQTPATSSDHSSPTPKTPAETYLQLQIDLHEYSMDKCTTFKFKMENCRDHKGEKVISPAYIGKCIQVPITKYSELLQALKVPETGPYFPLYMSLLSTYTYQRTAGLNIFFVYSVEAGNEGWQMVFAKSNQQGKGSVYNHRAKTSSGTFPLGKQYWRLCTRNNCKVEDQLGPGGYECEMEITIIKTGSDKQILVLDLDAPEEAPAPPPEEVEVEGDQGPEQPEQPGQPGQAGPDLPAPRPELDDDDDEGGELTEEERAAADAAATAAAAHKVEQQKEWTALLAAAQKEKPQSDAEAAALLAEGQTLGGKKNAVGELIAGRP